MQRGLRTHIIHGFLAGIAAGCIISCCDAFYVAQSLYQIPVLYPVSLFLFNLFLWPGLGVFAGIMVALIVTRGGARNLNWYYGCWFLFPVVLLYGLLGRLTFPIYAWRNLPKIHAYDNHLSFVFVAILIGYRLYILRKHSRGSGGRAQFFVLEFAAAALLYHFCSNLNVIVSALFNREFSGSSMPLIYCVGVGVIFGLYWLGCFLKNRLLHKGYGFNGGMIAVLFCRHCCPFGRCFCVKLSR